MHAGITDTHLLSSVGLVQPKLEMKLENYSKAFLQHNNSSREGEWTRGGDLVA